MAHTPTPWNVRDSEIYTEPENTIAIDAGALCVAGVVGDDATAEANARLIVRAVNAFEPMREALEALVSLSHFVEVDQACWYCTECDNEAAIGQEIEHDHTCVIGKARTALALADAEAE